MELSHLRSAEHGYVWREKVFYQYFKDLGT